MRGSPVVLDVGPGVIRCRDGGHEPPAEMVAAVLDGIDDPVVLLDERPVRVDDLLRGVIAQALGRRCAEVLLVHPPDWPAPRVARVLTAVRASAGRVDSIAPGEPIDDSDPRPVRARIRLRLSLIGSFIGLALVAGCVGLVSHHRRAGGPPTAAITATVVEGRVAVEVPDGWTVERLTRGPGSRRVRVASPVDPDQAVHITQSYAPRSTLADAAGSLGRVAAAQSAFTDFRGEAEVAGRPAVTYREVRPGRTVRWVVLLDGVTRISIGCQSRPGAEDGIREACEQAIRSARELEGTVPGR